MLELVSITIPTFNSAKTLRKCLDSIGQQTYSDIEVIIIDSNSKDTTVEIAKEFGCKVYNYSSALLGARVFGVKKSEGQYVLLLDSDQILEKTAIQRAVGMIKNYDMLWLEEHTYAPKTILEKLFDADRLLVQKYASNFLSPLGGVILPRFFKKELLEAALANIPKRILPFCVAHDHAIIYYEAHKLSNKIGKLPFAVLHIEPSSIAKLWKKSYRYGKTTRALVEVGVYKHLIRSKIHFRKFYVQDLSLSLKSFLLRILRGVPYSLGYYFGK